MADVGQALASALGPPVECILPTGLPLRVLGRWEEGPRGLLPCLKLGPFVTLMEALAQLRAAELSVMIGMLSICLLGQPQATCGY